MTPSSISLIQLTDACVACGLCVPHCPSYQKLGTEADSPRGRIALMRGVLDARIPANERFIEHIDRCLTCRACERACPNHVHFGELITGMRAQIAPLRPRLVRWFESAARAILVRPRVLETLAPFVALCRASRAGRFLPQALATWLSRATSKADFRAFYPAHGKARGEVALFLGCVARVFDNETLRSAIFVLNRMGYGVTVPESQTCCGALSRQAGDLTQANKLARRNVRAFASTDTVVTTASGCGLALAEYGEDYGEHAFSRRVIDISDFLANLPGTERLASPNVKIAVHEPCTQARANSAMQLLNKIAGVETVRLAGNDQCCGAAGAYFLTQRKIAEALRDDKVSAFAESGANLLVTSNVGCALHLHAGGVEAIHPVTFIARQHARS